VRQESINTKGYLQEEIWKSASEDKTINE